MEKALLSLRSVFKDKNFSWKSAKAYLSIFVGCLAQAFAMRLFLIPTRLASGGISGIAQIINHYIDFPIGLMVFLANIPLFILGWRFLGGHRFALRTAFAIATFSFFVDFLVLFLPSQGLTNDLVLNALYGGVISGIGYGLVYRGQGTSGGSDILCRILNRWKGIPLSQTYFLTDSLVIMLAGLAFNWEHALYGLVVLYVSGLAAEVTLEGTNVIHTAMIITSEPELVAQQIMTVMARGVTFLSGKGAYTGSERPVLYCVVSRAEVSPLKAIIQEVDPQAFIVIGKAHEVFGEGFKPLTKE